MHLSAYQDPTIGFFYLLLILQVGPLLNLSSSLTLKRHVYLDAWFLGISFLVGNSVFVVVVAWFWICTNLIINYIVKYDATFYTVTITSDYPFLIKILLDKI